MDDELDNSFEDEYNDEKENKEEIKVILDKSDDLNDKFDQKFKKDMDTLLIMGYEAKMVRKVYIFLKPNDINEAIEYLSQEKGIYHHDFMERYGQNNKCFICGQSAANHINYKPKKNSIIDSIKNSVGYSSKEKNGNEESNNTYSSDKENEKNMLNEPFIDSENKKDIKITVSNKKPINCDLCLMEMNEDEIIKNKLSCNHLFCDDCYLNYLQEKIKNNKVGKISCMQFKCPQEFDDEFIISHLNQDQILIDKYKKFKLRNELYSNANIKFCPIGDCESYAKKEGDNNYVTCLEGHQFCFQCSKPWHGNKKCQDEIDKDFKKWKRNKIVKRCPNCKFWTEKNSGCNHMTCPECKYEWCWFCGKKCDVGHFKMGGGCYGLQFTNKNCYNYCLILYLYKFSIWLFQSFMLIFYIPALMIVYGLSFSDNEFIDKYPKVLYYITVAYFILCYLPLFVGLGSIFFIVCSLVWFLKKKAITFLLDLAGY